MDDEREQQLERFGDAVERKNEEAKAASEQREEQHAHGSEVDGDQAGLTAHERPQDVGSVREKSSGKGKKTADKWNQ